MIKRENRAHELAVRNGIELSLTEGNLTALHMMERAGLSSEIINRVLFEPNQVRNIDQCLMRRMHLA